MADTSNLTNFLGDIADAIRTKKVSSSEIPAANFDTEILSIETGTDTSDATATQYDVISPKTFYNKDGKIIGGIIPTYNSGSSYGENVVSIPDNSMDILGFKIRKNIIIYYTSEELVVLNINSQNSSRYSYNDLGITNITEVDISMNDTKISIMDGSSSFIYKIINNDVDTSIDISSKKTLSYVRCNFIDIVDTDAIASNGTYSSTVTSTYRITFNNDDLTYTETESYSGNWYRAGRASYQGCATTIYNGWGASGWSVMGMPSSTTAGREVTFQDLGSDLHCSPNNVYAIARNGSKYTVKNMDTNTSVKTFSIPTDFVRFATDTILFIISNGVITLYDFINNKYIQTVNIPGTVKNVSAANNGNMLYILSTDGLFTMGTNYIVSLTRLGNTYITTNDGNVKASDILENKIAYSNGSKIVGTMPNNGAKIITPSDSQITIPAGYHNGNGYVEATNIANLQEYKECEIIADAILNGSPLHSELQYLTMSGTQYIDPQVTVDSNYILEIKYLLTGSSSGMGRMFGGSSDMYFEMAAEETNAFRWSINGISATVLFTSGTPHIFKCYGNGLCYLDGTQKANLARNQTSTKLWLFNNFDHTERVKGNFYYCKIWNGSTLVRDFVPVQTTSGEICLYDKVSKTYFKNAGTGSFTAGPVV